MLLRSSCLIAIGIASIIVIVLIPQSQGQSSTATCTTLPVSQYKAVNLIDKRLVAKEAREWLTFTTPSMYDRLNEIGSMGLNAIRVPLFWEAYIVDPMAFVKGLQEISITADQLNMCIVYDFHQVQTGSHFDHWVGGGFPSFLTGSYSADRDGEKAFWADYYDNNISYNDTKIWDLHFNFIRDVIIKHVDNHPSTAGYEILNEPAVYECNQFAKLGDVYTYIGNKIRSVTLKPIYFDRADNHSCPYWNYEPYDSLVVPRGVFNVVFAPHIYTTGSPTTLTYLISLSQKWQPGMPVFIGEWGQQPPNDVVTQDVVNAYLQAFKSNNVGWAYWSWDPIFTFAIKDQSYQDTIYKAYLQNGINSFYGN
jgi:Cellulase (glycosyl hydrolase family 5)